MFEVKIRRSYVMKPRPKLKNKSMRKSHCIFNIFLLIYKIISISKFRKSFKLSYQIFIYIVQTSVFQKKLMAYVFNKTASDYVIKYVTFLQFKYTKHFFLVSY